MVLVAFSETITALYVKCGKEYDSKSENLQGKHLIYATPLPTEVKTVGGLLVQQMMLLFRLVLRGHFINHLFLKVLVIHITKSENSLSSYLPFGYKYLKYLSISFRQEVDPVLEYNPSLWMINENEFDAHIENIDLRN